MIWAIKGAILQRNEYTGADSTCHEIFGETQLVRESVDAVMIDTLGHAIIS